MKRLKLALTAATLCAALYGGYVAYDYATMTEQERMFLANVEALTQKEPGDSAGSDCPNGGYYSKGSRSSIDGTEFELIKFESGVSSSVGFFPTKALALEASTELTVKFEIKSYSWIEYNCDQLSDNKCLICNRYRY